MNAMDDVRAAVRLTHAEIYREAARMLEVRETFCHAKEGCGRSCCALSVLSLDDDDNSEYLAVQQPYAARFRDAQWWNGADTEENRAARVAALREMADIAERKPARHQSGEAIIAILLILSVLCAFGSVFTHPHVKVAQVEAVNQQEGISQ